MSKYVVLKDSYGNELVLTQEQAKDHVLVHHDNMIWAIHPFQDYVNGDWVELCFLPTYNGVWDEELQENVFIPETWNEAHENDPLIIYKHFYHNLAHPGKKPRWGFTSPWKEDIEKDPYCIYSYTKPWIVEDDEKGGE